MMLDVLWYLMNAATFATGLSSCFVKRWRGDRLEVATGDVVVGVLMMLAAFYMFAAVFVAGGFRS